MCALQFLFYAFLILCILMYNASFVKPLFFTGSFHKLLEIPLVFLQPTTANVLTHGSRRPRRRVLCANSASHGTTQSTPSPTLTRKPEDAERKKEQKATQTQSAHLCFGHLTKDCRQGVQEPIQPRPPPPPPLPSASLPPLTATHPSWAMKVTTPHRRTQTQKVMTQEEIISTVMMTQLSSLVGKACKYNDLILDAV